MGCDGMDGMRIHLGAGQMDALDEDLADVTQTVIMVSGNDTYLNTLAWCRVLFDIVSGFGTILFE